MQGPRNILPSLRKVSTQLAFVLGTALFFLLFAVFYRPFDIVEDFSPIEGRFSFVVTLAMCIILVVLLISRTLLMLFYEKVVRDWWHYIGWCFLELVAITLFVALLLCLMRSEHQFFSEVSLCAKYVFGILVFPYFIFTLFAAFYASLQNDAEEKVSSSILRFKDSSGQLKFAVAKDAVIFIGAEENYIRIHYFDEGRIKEYQLRASMSSVENMVTREGLFRCHRSYYVNPSHIKALRKDKYNQISAEMDTAGVTVPVSRTAYGRLSAII